MKDSFNQLDSLVSSSNSLLVTAQHTLEDVEGHFGIATGYLKQNLILGIKPLIGKTLEYKEGFMHVISLENGKMTKITKFPVPLKNETGVSKEKNIVQTRWQKLMAIPAANDSSYAIAA